MTCGLDARHASAMPGKLSRPRDESGGVETVWRSRGDAVKTWLRGLVSPASAAGHLRSERYLAEGRRAISVAISQGHERSTTATAGRQTQLLNSFIGHDLSDSQADSSGF
jgi:hypothetical protein